MIGPELHVKMISPDNICIDRIKFHSMNFILNAVETGWTVRKRKGGYIFSRKINGKREIMQKNYLENFIHANMQTV